jgi:hypothetical protein
MVSARVLRTPRARSTSRGEAPRCSSCGRAGGGRRPPAARGAARGSPTAPRRGSRRRPPRPPPGRAVASSRARGSGRRARHLPRDAAAGVGAVRDVADRHLVLGQAGEVGAEQPARDLAVQLAHAVREGGGAQRQRRHVEARGLVGPSGRPRARSSARERPSSWAVRSPKYLSMSSGGNTSLPAGTGVWVVKTLPARAASRPSAEAEPVLSHEHADALEAEEGRVALVHVAHRRLEAQRAQGAQAADPEHDLLRMRFSWSPP